MVRMWIYLPISDDPNGDGYVPPSIDVHGPKLLAAIVDARKNPDANAPPQHGGHGNQNNTSEMKAVKNFHQNLKGWIDVLAWSNGNSSKNMQDLSLTKYADQYSPIFSGTAIAITAAPHVNLQLWS